MLSSESVRPLGQPRETKPILGEAFVRVAAPAASISWVMFRFSPIPSRKTPFRGFYSSSISAALMTLPDFSVSPAWNLGEFVGLGGPASCRCLRDWESGLG